VRASEGRGWRGAQAFEDGMSQEQLHEYTNIDPWFLAQLGELHQTESWLRSQSLDALSAADLVQIKRRGFSDPQIAKAVGARHCVLDGRALQLSLDNGCGCLFGHNLVQIKRRGFSVPQVAKAVGVLLRFTRWNNL